MSVELPRRSARQIPRSTWHQRLNESLSPGERAADAMRNGMGSWRFVGGFILFMGVWAAVNTLWLGWDEYPYILLNLFLSMLAGLQGAILLIAAKRQDGISAALAQHDFDTNSAAKIDIELLLEMNRRQLVLMDELQRTLERLDIPTSSTDDATDAPHRSRTDRPPQEDLRPRGARIEAAKLHVPGREPTWAAPDPQPSGMIPDHLSEKEF